jgi:hypothetical protein
LEIEISDIQDCNHYNSFTSHKDGTTYSAHVLDLIIADSSSTLHVGFLTPEAEELSRQLKEICIKHRQKPKIFQFNSVDVDGVEILVP